MERKYCCNCNKALVNLYQNTRSKGIRQLTPRAYYCKYCKKVFKVKEVCIKNIVFLKNGDDKKWKEKNLKEN